jgi:hypothetical protein
LVVASAESRGKADSSRLKGVRNDNLGIFSGRWPRLLISLSTPGREDARSLRSIRACPERSRKGGNGNVLSWNGFRICVGGIASRPVAQNATRAGHPEFHYRKRDQNQGPRSRELRLDCLFSVRHLTKTGTSRAATREPLYLNSTSPALTCASITLRPGPVHLIIRHNPPLSRLKAGA